MRSYLGIDLGVYQDQAERANMARIHNFLQDASRALSSNVAATSSSVGAAPSDGAYLMIGNNASLSAERAIVTTSPLTATDGGADSSYTLGVTISAIDHGGLGGLGDAADHTWALLVNGSRPLTSAWDAGNFAITLGSIVGKSGNLSIAPASGGNISFSTSIASGASNHGWAFTDTVARTAGTLLTLDNSAGDRRFGINAPGAGAAFTFGVDSSGTTQYSSVWNVSGTITKATTGSAALDVGGWTNLGTGPIAGARLIATAGCTTSSTFMQAGGFDVFPKYATTSAFGINAGANDIYGGNIVLSYTNGASTGTNINAWNLLLGNTGTAVGNILRWAGILIPGRPTSIVSTNAVGIHSTETINVTAGTKITFDGTATVGVSATQFANTFTAYTEGDTYLTYNSGSTQLDLYVDAAQAFHFDAGGAAGTSACYGNFAIPSSGILYFDGVGGNDYMQYAAGLLRTTIGGATIGDWYSGGIDIASGKTFSINSTRLILAEAQLTHAPSSAAVFTMDLNDALYITDNSTGTTRVLVDAFWNQPDSTGRRGLLDIRDQTNTYLDIDSVVGIANLRKESNTTWYATDLSAGDVFWIFDTNAATPGSNPKHTSWKVNNVEIGYLGDSGSLDVNQDVRGRQMIADGDNAGVASTTSLTNAAPALGGGAAPTLGTIGGSGPAGAAQVGWVKIYVGTTASYVPYWQ